MAKKPKTQFVVTEKESEPKQAPITFTVDETKTDAAKHIPAAKEENPTAPPKAGMSIRGIERCRRMLIRPVGDVEDRRTQVLVYAPAPDNRIISEQIVRTEQDLARVRMAFMAKYRIPKENVGVRSVENNLSA